MPPRRDSLTPPESPVGLRLVVSTATRDKLMAIAYEHGYSMASLLRLVAEDLASDPDRVLAKIPRNPKKNK